MHLQVAEQFRSRGEAFLVMTGSMTMETMAVKTAFNWLESHDYTRAGGSMSMTAKVQTGLLHMQWLESV